MSFVLSTQAGEQLGLSGKGPGICESWMQAGSIFGPASRSISFAAGACTQELALRQHGEMMTTISLFLNISQVGRELPLHTLDFKPLAPPNMPLSVPHISPPWNIFSTAMVSPKAPLH